MAGQRLSSRISRAALKFWKIVPDADVRLEKPPDLVNNESLESINAAGTGVVALIKADGSNVVTLPNGFTVPSGQSPTFNGGLTVPAGQITNLNGTNHIQTLADLSATRIFINEKTVTDAGVNLFEVALPAGAMWGGFLFWTLQASDGTDSQAFSGVTTISAVNKAGVYTKTITELAGIQAKAVSAGTLTEAVTQVDGTNKVTYVFTPTGSLTETTYRLSFALINNSRQAVTLL